MQLPGPPTLTRLSNLCTGSGSNRLQERIQYRVIAISKLIQSSSPHYLRDIITIQPSRSGLRNPLVPFCHERSQTGEEGLTIRICRTRRRLSIFGHVRRLPEATPAHSALRLAVDARTGVKPRASGQSGSASEDDPAERGCSRSRTTLGVTFMSEVKSEYRNL